MPTEQETLLEVVLGRLKTDEQRSAFKDAVEAFKPLVAEIEKQPETTQENYRHYLKYATSVINCLMLLCAGANRKGVAGAAMVNGVGL